MAKCETECRDEIFEKLDKKADRSGVWKFTSIIVAVVVVICGIICLPFEESRKQTHLNTLQIMKLTTIVEQQSKSNNSLTSEVKELIREIKK